MKNFSSFIFEIFKIVLLALIVVIPIRYFIFQPFIVKGVSMEPNFKNGDYLIIDEISYRFKEPKRGEVVIFKYPQNPSHRFIKRIIGLPNETIEIEGAKIIILKNGKEEVLNEMDYLSFQFYLGKMEVNLKGNEYFVLGDNRDVSFDSREWGILPREYIIGKAIFRAWPFNALATFFAPEYAK